MTNATDGRFNGTEEELNAILCMRISASQKESGGWVKPSCRPNCKADCQELNRETDKPKSRGIPTIQWRRRIWSALCFGERRIQQEDPVIRRRVEVLIKIKMKTKPKKKENQRSKTRTSFLGSVATRQRFCKFYL